MKFKSRTEIRVEMHETTIIRFRREDNTFCPRCRRRTPKLSAAQAADALSLAPDELARLARDGRLHLNAAGDICGASLAAFDQKPIETME